MLVIQPQHEQFADGGVVLEVGTDARETPRCQECREPTIARKVSPGSGNQRPKKNLQYVPAWLGHLETLGRAWYCSP